MTLDRPRPRVVTPSHKPPGVLRAELDAVALPRPDRQVGARHRRLGRLLAFEAERRGAARVAVVDHYMWAMDSPGQQAYWRLCMQEGVEPRPYHETEFWHPDTLPGMRGFELAREARGSAVEAIVEDFVTLDVAALGRWDVVLYLGVLYHMEDPLRALRRVAAVTRELAVVETEAVAIAALEHEALWRFFPGADQRRRLELVGAEPVGLGGALTAAGFAAADAKLGPSAELLAGGDGPHHYRAVVHAVR